MNSNWKTGAYSTNTTPVSADEKAMEEIGVILMQGKNVYGDPIYTYLRLPIKNLIVMREKIVRRENFMPAEYGEVLAAGKGEPSAELRSEMAVAHNMIDVPKPKPAVNQAFGAPQTKLWD